MTPNPLTRLAAEDRHPGTSGFCRVCFSTVSTYNANRSLIAQRPEAADDDWWIACDNADCEHAYGEDVGQEPPEWVIQKWSGHASPPRIRHPTAEEIEADHGA